MQTSRTATIDRLQIVLSNRDVKRSIRHLSITNQWLDPFQAVIGQPHAWTMPRFFRPLHEVLSQVVSQTRLQKLSLNGVYVNDNLLAAIATSKTIESLHLARCSSSLLAPPRHRDPLHITSLTLKLQTRQTQRSCSPWLILGLCPSLRNLVIHGGGNAKIYLSTPEVDSPTAKLRQVQYLNIEDCDPCLHSLCRWYFYYIATPNAPPSLTHLKISTTTGIQPSDNHKLLDILRHCGATLRNLVVDGLFAIPVSLLESIAAAAPQLRGLTLLRRANIEYRHSSLTTWSEPAHLYAEALSLFTHLEHFGANFNWTPWCYSPRCLDIFLTGQDCGDIVNWLVARGKRQYSPVPSEAARMQCNSSAVDLVLPFAEACPTLRTFALTAHHVIFTCSITRLTKGTANNGEGPYIENEVHYGCKNRHSEWNPLLEHPWPT